MASFEVTGFINTIKYLPDHCLVFIDEFKKGYKKKDGSRIDDRYITWKCIFKPYFKGYIVNHFNNGMLVQVKGEVMPYAIDHEKVVEGCSVIGQTINIASFPKSMIKQEAKMIKESLENTKEMPNLQEHMRPDF